MLFGPAVGGMSATGGGCVRAHRGGRPPRHVPVAAPRPADRRDAVEQALVARTIGPANERGQVARYARIFAALARAGIARKNLYEP
jgi:hypothetical protein